MEREEIKAFLAKIMQERGIQQPEQTVVAEEPAAISNAATEQVSETSDTIDGYTEIISERKENVKVFGKQDGTKKLIISDKPIHVLDENSGQFIDPDNGVIDTSDCFISRKAGYKAKFYKDTHSGKLADIEKDGYKVSFELSGCNCENVCACRKTTDESELIYENILNAADIAYVSESDRVKESIVVKQKQNSYRYIFTLRTENLIAEMKLQGKVISLKNADGKEVFEIPAPYMQDSSGVKSFDVIYGLETTGDSVYTLTVTADANWINAEERLFPIIIDPTLAVSADNRINLNTYDINGIAADTSSLVTYAHNYFVGAEIDYEALLAAYGLTTGNVTKCDLLINGSDAFFTYYVYCFPTNQLVISSSGNGYIYSIPLKEIYEASGSASFFFTTGEYTYYSYSGKTLEIEYTGTATPVLESILVTNAPTKTSYTEGQSLDKTGLVVKANYTNGTTATLASSAYTCTPSSLGFNDSAVTVSYTANGVTKTATQSVYVTRKGASDKSLTNSLNRAGTGVLDLYTKNIKFVHSDISADTQQWSFSVSHIYNAKYAGQNNTYCGSGWQTNFHQRIVSQTAIDDSDAKYIYIDGSGERNKIVQSKDEDNNIIYVLDENKSTKYNPTTRTLTDKNGNKSTFNSDGWLIEQLSNGGYKITIAYSGEGKISYIYEGIASSYKKRFVFSYTGSLLTSITFISNDIQRTNKVYFEYPAGHLAKIYYETNNGSDYSTFTYDSIGVLQSAQDPTGHMVSYAFSGKTVTVTETPGSVIKDSDVTASISSAAPSSKVWTVRYGDNTRVTKDGHTTVLGFNSKNKYSYSYIDKSNGSNTDELNVTSDLEITQSTDQKESGTSFVDDVEQKVGTVSASVSKNMPSLVTSFDFSNSNNSIYNPTVVSSPCVDGSGSIRISRASGGTMGFRCITGTADVASKKGYVVSCFAMLKNYIGSFQLAAKLFDGNDTVIDEGVWRYSLTNSEWQVGAICLDNPSNLGGTRRIEVHVTSTDTYVNSNPMYIANLRVVESTFSKSESMQDNNHTPQIEAQKNVFGNGERNETSYLTETVTVSEGNNTYTYYKPLLHLSKQKYYDEFGNVYTTDYRYDESNGKLLSQTTSRGITDEYTYNGYMGGMSKHKRYSSSSVDTNLNTADTSVAGRLTETDTFSNKTETNLYTALTQKQEDAAGNKTNFSYLTNGDLSSMTLTPAATQGNSYYYTKFLLTKAVSVNNTIHYIYDGYGQLLQVNVNGVMAKKYAYKDNCNYKTTSLESGFNYEEQTVPHGSSSTYSQKTIYNADGLPLKKQEKTGSGSYSDIVTASYAASDSGGYKTGELKTISDTASGSTLTQTFTYDTTTRQVNKVTYSGARSGSISNTVTKGGKLRNKDIIFDNDAINYGYSYTQLFNLPNPNVPMGNCVLFSCGINGNSWLGATTYNTLEKPNGRILLSEGSDNYPYVATPKAQDIYGYSSDQKTVSSVYHYLGSTLYNTESYGYDSRKNISSHTDIMGKNHRYVYDAANRLIREDDQVSGVTKTYEYSNTGGGNMTKMTSYAYTAANVTPTNGYEYVLNYINGTDKLSSVTYNGTVVNGYLVTYDSAGNPLQWKGNVLQWNRGRRLVNYGNMTSYKYDAGGIRQSKTAGSTTHTYYTEGSTIHKEERRNGNTLTHKLIYGYDESGIAVIVHNGNIYYMMKNIQGDVVGLVDNNGSVVAKYAYDAWGNHRVYNGSGTKIYDSLNNVTESGYTNHIGVVNPWRYRGYYFDADTQLYYLQTRYYDPYMGRFLNTDSVDYADPSSFNGLNLYAYCGNNPVMRVDPTGLEWWDTWWGKLLGWIAVGAIAITALAMVVASTLATGGLATAVLLGTGIGAMTGLAGNFAAQGGVNNISNVNPWAVAGTGLIGGAIGAATGVLSYGMGVVGSKIGEFVGSYLYNTTIAGLKITQAISSTLMGIGSVVGGVVGGIVGSAAGNYMVNSTRSIITGKTTDPNEFTTDLISGEIPGWVLSIFKWLWALC